MEACHAKGVGTDKEGNIFCYPIREISVISGFSPC